MVVSDGIRRLSPNAPGFTLVELLVASTMVAVLFAGLGAHLRGGITVWERATTTAERLQRGRVALDRLERELASGVVYDAREDAYGEQTGALPSPEFTEDRLAWFTAAPAGRDEMPAIRFVTYGCDRREGQDGLWRTSQSIGEARGKESVQAELVLPGCLAMRIRYAYAPLDIAAPLVWRTEWPAPIATLPRLVEVTLTAASGDTVQRAIMVPAGRLAVETSG